MFPGWDANHQFATVCCTAILPRNYSQCKKKIDYFYMLGKLTTLREIPIKKHRSHCVMVMTFLQVYTLTPHAGWSKIEASSL